MAGRFYRHDVGITPDQIRAARQIRLARTAARGSFAVWLLIVLLVLIPLPFGARLPEPLLAAIVLVGAGLLMAAGAVTLTLAFSRGRLSDGDRFHARVGRLALLLPVVMLAGVALAEVTGAGIWTVGLLTVLMIAVALSDKALDRLERHGRHTESRVCVIDLESGERIWHRHSDLRAVDEAAEIVAVHDAELGEGLV